MSQSFTFVPRSTNKDRRSTRRPTPTISLADFIVKSGNDSGVAIPDNSQKNSTFKFREKPKRKLAKKVSFEISSPPSSKTVNTVPLAPKKLKQPLDFNKSTILKNRRTKPPLHPNIAAVRNIEDSLVMEKAVMLRNTRRRMANTEKEFAQLKETNEQIMGDLCESCMENDLWREAHKASEKYIYQLEIVSKLYNSLIQQAKLITSVNKKPVIQFSPDGFVSIIGEDIN
jgi:hypothetical protein